MFGQEDLIASLHVQKKFYSYFLLESGFWKFLTVQYFKKFLNNFQSHLSSKTFKGFENWKFEGKAVEVDFIDWCRSF